MMKFIATLAGIIAVSSGETFRWMPNNDYDSGNNWVGDQYNAATVDFDVACLDSSKQVVFAKGMEISIPDGSKIETGNFNIPMDGVLSFGDDVTISIDEQDKSLSGTATWQCKTEEQTNSACAGNYQVSNGTGWATAIRPPCFLDSVQMRKDVATSMQWHPGQVIRDLRLTNNAEWELSSNSKEYFRKTDFLVDYTAANPKWFQGESPPLGNFGKDSCGGAVACAAMCMNTCPSLSIDEAIDDESKWFNIPAVERDAIVLALEAEIEQIEAMRVKFLETPIGDTLSELANEQAEYEGFIANLTQSDAKENKMTSKATMADFSEWYTDSNPDRIHEHFFAKTFLTKSLAETTIDFLNNAPLEMFFRLGNHINDPNSVDIGDRRRSAENFVEVVVEDANNFIKTYTAPPHSQITIESITATAYDDTNDFGSAVGAYQLNGLEVNGKIYENNEGKLFSAIDESYLAKVVALSMFKVTMFVKEYRWKELLRDHPTTTVSPTMSPTTTPTLSPTTTPTLSPTSDVAFLESAMGLGVVAGGAGFIFLLIVIIIIVIVVLKKGGSKQNDQYPSSERVAFENPTYEDNKHNPTYSSQDGLNEPADGLYDEPTMVTQNGDGYPDSGADGYLEVQEDDSTDEDDSDLEDE